MSAQLITLPAFAKINSNLRVLGKRPDGYHEIDTVLQTISLHDTLTFRGTNDSQISLSCDDPSVPADERNLVWRAAATLQSHLRVKHGVLIRLEKRIPHQAGLGGGSSDAAVTLLALVSLWKLDIKQGDLTKIAEGLGADVPFFLQGGTARGTGRGSTLTALEDRPDTFLLALKPRTSVSTAKAYSTLNSPTLTTSGAKIILSSSQAGTFSTGSDLNAWHNDFEAVVLKLEPEIERAKAALLKSGAHTALLAGSGSAVFGVFEDKDAQERAIQAIKLEAGWRVFPCKTVGRRHYETALGAAGEFFARLSGENAGA